MDRLQHLQAERETEVNKLYKVLFSVVAIMVIPPIAAALLGNYLKLLFKTPTLLTLGLVALASGLSYLAVYKLYRRLDITMVELDAKIKEAREELGIPTKKVPEQQKKDDT